MPNAQPAYAALTLALVWLGVWPGMATAEEEAGRRAGFQVEVSREVPNDWMRAVLSVSEEDADAALAAERVNRAMTWALEKARGAEAIESDTGGYHSVPVSHEGRIRRWRVSQELVLESADAEAMALLMGALQERLEVRSFRFSVSESRRREVEDELVEEGLAAFRARALLVRRGLEARSHAIDRVDIDTGRRFAPVAPMRMAEARSVAPAAAPALEAGSTRLSVTVRGTIVLE